MSCHQKCSHSSHPHNNYVLFHPHYWLIIRVDRQTLLLLTFAIIVPLPRHLTTAAMWSTVTYLLHRAKILSNKWHLHLCEINKRGATFCRGHSFQRSWFAVLWAQLCWSLLLNSLATYGCRVLFSWDEVDTGCHPGRDHHISRKVQAWRQALQTIWAKNLSMNPSICFSCFSSYTPIGSTHIFKHQQYNLGSGWSSPAPTLPQVPTSSYYVYYMDLVSTCNTYIRCPAA